MFTLLWQQVNLQHKFGRELWLWEKRVYKTLVAHVQGLDLETTCWSPISSLYWRTLYNLYINDAVWPQLVKTNTGPCARTKMELVAVTTLFCYVIACYSAFTQVVHVQPTHPLNVTCQDCYTLNEWIESGFVPFANDTIVLLLPGNHLITSERRRLITKNASSLLIIGSEGDPVNVSCLHGLVFELHNSIDVRIALHSTLVLLTAQAYLV